MKTTTALRLLHRSLHTRGFRGTVWRMRRLSAARQELRRTTRADRRFDNEHGVETAAWVRVPDLDTTSPDRRFAVRYQPSSVDEFELLMTKLRRIVDVSDFTFVDYGSGKGRALILAAGHPFRRIVGVEFAESLHRMSRINVATLGDDAARVETVLGDATEFDPPSGPLVMYFFHPFDLPILRSVLERIRHSIATNPRPAYVVVTGPPEFARAVEEGGFERLDVDELGWITRGVFRAPATFGSVRRDAAA